MLLSPYLLTTLIDRECEGFPDPPCGEPTTHTVVMAQTADDGATNITVRHFCEHHAEVANATFSPGENKA